MSKQRLYFIFSVFLFIWGVLVARAAFVQIFPNERLAQLKRRQFETTLQIPSRRGLIMDRNGRELAASIASYSLYADPKILEDRNQTIKELNKILHIPVAQLKAKFKDRSRRFVWLKRQMPENEMQKVKQLENRGLAFFEEPKRIYPNGTLLAHTLGFVGTEGQGLEGIELRWEQMLRGEMKRVMVQRDARGRPLISESRPLIETPDGSDLELTIDSEMQFQLEKELEKAVAEQQADSAIGMILDVKSSEILAMGSIPTYDLNDASQVSAKVRRNRVITDAFEPGSTLKTFVIASALEEKLIKPASRFYCEKGKMKVGDKWINDDTGHHFEWLTTTEILAYSSNIGAAKIGFMLGDDKLKKHLELFGFGQRSGLDISGEAKGIMQALPWRPHLLSNISFGHGIAVTPLQLVMGYAAVANGGELKTPLLVKAVRNKMLGEEEIFEAKTLRRVMSPATAGTLRMMLTAATSDQGTGSKARLPGFLVAGKTGTAQKVDLEKGGYVKNAYISSFAGFVPANNPRFVIYVAVDNPKKTYYGSQVAAPLFAKLAQFAVRREGVAPTLITERNVIKAPPKRSPASESANLTPVLVEEGSRVPDLYGLTLREALAKLHGQPIAIDVHGSGQIVRTVPNPGEEMPADRNLKLILENPN